jgi:hypothetical protein
LKADDAPLWYRLTAQDQRLASPLLFMYAQDPLTPNMKSVLASLSRLHLTSAYASLLARLLVFFTKEMYQEDTNYTKPMH